MLEHDVCVLFHHVRPSTASHAVIYFRILISKNVLIGKRYSLTPWLNQGCRYVVQGVRAVDYGLLFQPLPIGFDCISTSGLLFSTVSGWRRLQLRLSTSRLRFQKFPRFARPVFFIKVFITAFLFTKSIIKISALRAASSLYKSLYNCISLFIKPHKKFRAARGHFPLYKSLCHS